MYHLDCSNRCSDQSFRITHQLKLGRIIGILALCAGLLAAFPAWAQPVQHVVSSFAGTGAGDWSTPSNVVGPPDNKCSNMGAVGKSNLTYNFDFMIPESATITGATAFVKAGANSNQNIGVQLASNASVEPPVLIGAQRTLAVPEVANAACSSTTVVSTGGTLAAWTVGSLTPATVNNTQFGLVFTKLATSTLKVDSICLEIAYQTSSGTAQQLACSREVEPPPENTISRATFRVTKDFTDDNPSEVMVSIDCNTGLILDQSKLISEANHVVFVVTDFDSATLDCHISEVIPGGYSPSYEAGILDGESNAVTADELGCHFESVEFGEFYCDIVNTPDPVNVVIEKVWVIDGSGGDGVDTGYELRLYCDAEIVGGSDEYCYVNGISKVVNGTIWCDTFYGEDSDIFTSQVIPGYPSSQCWVHETAYENYVEIDNGCKDLVVSAGQGDSCVITNTVFFEGIPTLGQYGKILLVMLMLGVGMVGFRRFVA